MEYISHEDFKGFMAKLQASSPKGMLQELHKLEDDGATEFQQLSVDLDSSGMNEELEKEGNAFTAGLAKTKKGGEFKVDGKTVKDTSNYDAPIEEEVGDKVSISTKAINGKDGKQYNVVVLYQNTRSGLVGTPFAFEKPFTFTGTVDQETDKIANVKLDPGYEDVMATLFIANPKDGQHLKGRPELLSQVYQIHKGYTGFKKTDLKSQSSAPIKEADDEVDSKLAKIADLFKDKTIKHEEIEKIVKALTGQGHEVNVRYVQDFLNKHNVKLDEAPEGKAKVLGPVKGTSSTFTVQTPKGKVVDLDFDVEYGDKIDDHVYEGTLYAQDDEYQYILPAALIVGGGGSYTIEPYYKEFSAEPLGMEEAAYTDNYPGSWGYREGYSPDSSDFEQAIASELQTLGDEDLTDEEYEKALEALENPKIVGQLWGIHPKKAAMALAKMVRAGEMEEGLNMPPLQPTGQTIVTNEDQAPFGFSVLSPDERKQLKEYINSVKTIKQEIAKLLEKAGKSGKIMEDSRKEEDEKVPAERKPEYHNPTKKSKPGGNRTNLVMTKAEMWEGAGHEEIEHALGEKLHSTFSKVTDLAIKQLVDSGLDRMDAISFLKQEVEEKGKEAVMGQYDL